MADKKTLRSTDVTKTAGATGKTLTSLVCYVHGSVEVVEMNWNDATQSFIKFKSGQIEVGGTNEFGTGTMVLR